MGKLLTTGPEYALTKRKRVFDLMVAELLTPVYLQKKKEVAQEMARHGVNASVVMTQPRVGQNGNVFQMYKLRTLIPGTKKPISPRTQEMREAGEDEFAQVINIKRREMSAVNYRSLIPKEYAQWYNSLTDSERELNDKTVMIGRPGMGSTWGYLSHIGDFDHSHPEQARLEANLYDAENGSMAHDVSIMTRMVYGALHNLFVNGNVPVVGSELTLSQLNEAMPIPPISESPAA